MNIYIKFPPSADPQDIVKQLKERDTPGERALGVMLSDGSYHIIGSIVKADDCPQDIFDRAIEIISK